MTMIAIGLEHVLLLLSVRNENAGGVGRGATPHSDFVSPSRVVAFSVRKTTSLSRSVRGLIFLRRCCRQNDVGTEE